MMNGFWGFSRIALGLLVSTVISAPHTAMANSAIERAARGLTLTDAIGWTLIGITRDSSKPWSLYLSPDKQAYFTFSSGSDGVATWRIAADDVICFRGLINNDPQAEICKSTTPQGRGMDWMTVEPVPGGGLLDFQPVTDEHRGSSQMVFAHEGRHVANQHPVSQNLDDWRGKTVIGRTLRDRETWIADFRADGSVDFIYGSGTRLDGTYTLTRSQICISFPSQPEMAGCRKVIIVDDKLMWANTSDDSYISEVVYTVGSAEDDPTPDYVPRIINTIGNSTRPSYLGNVPDARVAVVADDVENEFIFYDDRNGELITTFNADGGIALATINGPYLAWIDDTGDAHIWDMAAKGGIAIRKFDINGQNVISLKVSRDGAYIAIGLADSGNILLLATEGSGSQVVLPVTGATHAVPVGFSSDSRNLTVSAGETGTAFKSISLLSIADENVIGFSDTSTPTPTRLPVQTTLSAPDGFSFNLVTMAQIGDFGIMIEEADDKSTRKLVQFSIAEGDLTRTRDTALTQTTPTAVSISRSGKDILLGSATGVVTSVDMLRNMAVDTVGASYGKPITAITHMGRNGDFVMTQTGKVGLRLVPRTEKNEISLTKNRDNQSFAVLTQIDNEANRIAAEVRAAEYAYLLLRSDASAHYKLGRCDEFEALAGDLKPEHQPELSCAENREKNLQQQAFDSAIDGLDCDVASQIFEQSSVGSTDRIQQCHDLVERNAQMVQFNAAVSAFDCDVVENLEGKLERLGASDICKRDKSLASGSPRQMFITGVQFDTAGNTEFAVSIYEEVMSRFPEDDMALQAAARIMVISDREMMAEAQVEREQAALDAKQREDDALAQRQAQEEEDKRAQQAQEERLNRIIAEEKRAEELRISEEREEARRAEQQAEEDLAEKISDIKSSLASLNSKYNLHSGYFTVSTSIEGKKHFYDISGSFSITPTVLSPQTVAELCNVTIASSTNPRYSRVDTGDYTYFEPSSGRSSFIVNLNSPYDNNFRMAIRASVGSQLFALDGDVNDYTSITNAIWVKIGWSVDVNKLYQEGAHYNANSRSTTMQIFGDLEDFYEDFRHLISTCSP